MQNRIRNFLGSRLLRTTGTQFGVVWALPLTLFGVILSLPIWILRGRLDKVPGSVPALLVRGPLADRLLARHPFGPMTAMAIGHIIIARQQPTASTLAHELEHVRQAARWGLTFPLIYLIASASALLHGRQAYWHNRFEIAARKAEKHPHADLCRPHEKI